MMIFYSYVMRLFILLFLLSHATCPSDCMDAHFVLPDVERRCPWHRRRRTLCVQLVLLIITNVTQFLNGMWNQGSICLWEETCFEKVCGVLVSQFHTLTDHSSSHSFLHAAWKWWVNLPRLVMARADTGDRPQLQTTPCHRRQDDGVAVAYRCSLTHTCIWQCKWTLTNSLTLLFQTPSQRCISCTGCYMRGDVFFVTAFSVFSTNQLAPSTLV